ncbi:MAG: hypothetical protein ACJ8AT_31545 [Hyalangium sp.]|uniref:hypothetical protein n=1 Tax=Hyalangium sp. TaxID=2028555 RepID=UPI00389AF8DC
MQAENSRFRIMNLCIIALLVPGCGIALARTPDSMSLQGPPWQATGDVDLGGVVKQSQKACHDQVEMLRQETEDAAKARDIRRIIVSATSGLLSAVGIALSASSASDDKTKSLSGYIVTGTGAATQLVDAFIPQNKSEALHAAWSQAYSLQTQAEARLSDLQRCSALPDPSKSQSCLGLDKAISTNVQQGPPPPGQDRSAEVRDIFLSKLQGDAVLVVIGNAFSQCMRIQASDFEKK